MRDPCEPLLGDPATSVVLGGRLSPSGATVPSAAVSRLVKAEEEFREWVQRFILVSCLAS